jgi:hypothetical protein
MTGGVYGRPSAQAIARMAMADKGKPTDTPDPDERDDDIYAVRLRVTPEQARALVETGEYDTGDHPRFSPNTDGSGSLDLFMSRAQADDLRGRGITLEIASNQSSRARARIAELGEGDRYEGGKATPRGIGRKIGGRGSRASGGSGGASGASGGSGSGDSTGGTERRS